jgi:hypothetical protein
MDDFKYSQAHAMPDPQRVDEAPAAQAAPTASGQTAANPAVEKFKSCRWKATPEQGDFCTHRDVLPFAGKVGCKPESWCPECAFYKLRRTPKKRERIDYSY